MPATALKVKQIGLLLDGPNRAAPKIMLGLSRWIHSNPGWRVTVFDGESSDLGRAARHWHGDGLVCDNVDEVICETAESRDTPIVIIGGHCHIPRGVSVFSDQAACGRLAANHFAARGFQRLAFIGTSETQFRENLAEEFLTHARELGAQTLEFAAPLGSERALADWLRVQSFPMAVLASSDNRAGTILDACHLAGLSVPEDVAILGVGNNVELCELCTPSLSSIDCDLETCGFEAAAALRHLLSGNEIPNAPIRVPPAGVVSRRSTESYAFDDPDLCGALRFINEHAHESIKVKDVLAATKISRRSLENRFRRYFSRSLHEEIWRVHFERAQELLTTTDLGLQAVAERSGFRTASALANLFKQKTGLTPRKYRAEHRR